MSPKPLVGVPFLAFVPPSNKYEMILPRLLLIDILLVVAPKLTIYLVKAVPKIPVKTYNDLKTQLFVGILETPALSLRLQTSSA